MKKVNSNKLLFLALTIFQVLCAQTILKAQSLQWVKSLPGDYFDNCTSMTHDAAGNTYIAGFYSSAILDVDPGPGVVNLVNAGGDDSFFGKYDLNGNYVWAHRIGGSFTELCRSVRLDKQGNVYISGVFGGSSPSTIDFDPGPGIANLTSAGLGDIFIAKYDNNGNYMWAERIGGADNEDCSKMEIDSIGNIYTTGTFLNTVDFDPGVGVNNLTSASATGNANTFIAKYDSNGAYVWANVLAGNADFSPVSILLDQQGNIYIGGRHYTTIDFDPGIGIANLTPDTSSYFDVAIAKYNNNGNYVWAKGISGPDDEYIGSINLDRFGNLYVLGTFKHTIDIDPGAGVDSLYIQPNLWSTYFAKFDTAGNYHWAKVIEGSSQIYIQTDTSGQVYLCGCSYNSMDFDLGYGIAHLSGGSAPLFVAKYDSTGNYIWGFPITGFANSADYCYIDDSMNIIVVGSFFHSDFDPSPGFDTLVSAGQDDIFIAKYSQGPCSSVCLNITGESDFNCANSIGSASALLTGGTLPYTYLWDTNPVSGGTSVNVSSPGLYTVTVSDLNGCTLSRTTLINGPDTLTAFDLTTNLISSVFRPNQPTTILLHGYNDGCTPVSGSLYLVLDTMLTFQNAVPAPSQISGDTLTWSFSSLIYDSLPVTPQINVTTNLSANIGDTIALHTFIYPSAGDANPSNNDKHYSYAVVNSYDPNIKEVYPQGIGTQGRILNNQTMTYSIQFQNTGTAEALNVFILDTVSSNLAVKSLKILASSHAMKSYVLPGNVIEFMFNDIHLPDSLSNEPQSHGYELYQIEQNPNLVNGTQIENTANIFFDYNSSVGTNTVANTIDLLVTGIQTDEKPGAVNIYPNPTLNDLTVEFANGTLSGIVAILDIQGRTITSEVVQQSNKVVFTTGDFERGMYFVKIIDEHKKSFNYKFIKD